jgi:arsenite/tail-anchored protein-transporting ATPase
MDIYMSLEAHTQEMCTAMRFDELIRKAPKYLFFTGKGGVGKTSLASATAIAIADAGERVLIVSTDPASNLDQVLRTEIESTPTLIRHVERLSALNIDPVEAAESYRQRALAPMLGVVSDDEVHAVREQLSGACTVEIAAFDEFTRLLIDGVDANQFDHIVFDTAPTGHTLRLLQLPAAWSSFIEINPRGASCLGPQSAVQHQQLQYDEAILALRDPSRTSVVLVARPEGGALAEAARTAHELRALGLENQCLAINGRFEASAPDDPWATALEDRGKRALQEMPDALSRLPQFSIPLQPSNLVGIDALRNLSAERDRQELPETRTEVSPDLPPLLALVDQLEADGPTLAMVMGKGGVGKTTIASAIAVELARRGHPVHLTTTDPAAHLTQTVCDALPSLTIDRIDPQVEVQAYRERVLATKGKRLLANELELLEEDLLSPCTEEVAVFHAFARTISRARTQFVVIDTAPTGHTLLLLDTTGAYHTEILRSLERGEGQAGLVTPLMRLRDPSFTRMVLLTLPESTPVQEAADLQADLKRAGIVPFAWVINNSLAATGTIDPVLRARAKEETVLIHRVEDDLSQRTFLVPRMLAEPVGIERLLELVHATAGVSA